MSTQYLKQAVVWGMLLWLIGYLLGIVFFMVLPHALIGWVIMPIGIALTLWVLLKKISFDSLKAYLGVGIIWALVAMVFDYFFLVRVFKPVDGYYKLDVYVYYVTTFLLPLLVGLKRSAKK